MAKNFLSDMKLNLAAAAKRLGESTVTQLENQLSIADEVADFGHSRDVYMHIMQYIADLPSSESTIHGAAYSPLAFGGFSSSPAVLALLRERANIVNIILETTSRRKGFLPLFSQAAKMSSTNVAFLLQNHPSIHEFLTQRAEAVAIHTDAAIKAHVYDLRFPSDHSLAVDGATEHKFLQSYQNQETRDYAERANERVFKLMTKQFIPAFFTLLDKHGWQYRPRSMLTMTRAQQNNLTTRNLSHGLYMPRSFMTPPQLAIHDLLGEIGIDPDTLWENSDSRANRVDFDMWMTSGALSMLTRKDSNLRYVTMCIGFGPFLAATDPSTAIIPLRRATPNGTGYGAETWGVYALHSSGDSDWKNEIDRARPMFEYGRALPNHADYFSTLANAMQIMNFWLTLLASTLRTGSGNAKPNWCETPLNQMTINHFEIALATTLPLIRDL